jgi:colanic acid/amylovoran biosynthesis glycosyltransferase
MAKSHKYEIKSYFRGLVLLYDEYMVGFSVLNNHRICIVTPDKDAYSETFIHSHIQNLPGKIYPLYGGTFPIYKDNGEALLQLPGFWHRVIQLILRKIFKVTLNEEAQRSKALKQFIIDNKIEAVLAEYGPTGHAIRNVCLEAGVPLIVHFHGYDAYEDKTLIKHNQYKELFAAAEAIIVVSKDMKKQLLELGAPPEKLKYIPYGIDLNQFNGAEPQNASPVFVAVGRFVDKKAPHLTLLAFKKVLEKVPEARLKMFGTGDLYEACCQLTKALQMNHAVSFKGSRSSHEIASEMRQARGFIQHSLRTNSGDSEGTPVAVLEAGASGLPVVSTRHGGIPDVVIDGQTGLLFDEGDINGMANAILKVAQYPILAGEMGRKAQIRIRENFNMGKSIQALSEVIENAINRNNLVRAKAYGF